jgi:uncharacterized membrane protein YidH (DUF202 family)
MGKLAEIRRRWRAADGLGDEGGESFVARSATDAEAAVGRHDGQPLPVVINEVQLILAEKRTALAFLRTGITVFALPLSVFSILIATSRYYDITRVLPFLIPLVVLNAGLVGLGAYLILRAIRKIHAYDRMIYRLKRKYSAISEFIE